MPAPFFPQSRACPLPRLSALGGLVLVFGLLTASPGLAADEAASATPVQPPATAIPSPQAALERGMALQKAGETQAAIAAYQQALKIDPDHGPTHYELGWSYWVLNQWAEVVAHWEKALALGVRHPALRAYLKQARERLAGKGADVIRVAIGTSAVATRPLDGAPGRLRLRLAVRFQNNNPRPLDPHDHFDRYVFSPKSARFSLDGAKVYVNALEGFSTLVYAARNWRRLGRIEHRFGPAEAALFAGEAGPAWLDFPPEAGIRAPNQFAGKPVESALSPDGRILWVPYYRRSFDEFARLPSAVALIDTTTDAIVRVMDTGPIPKYVAVSPDGRRVAITHWGDNTVGLIDSSATDPADYRRLALITVGRRPDLRQMQDTDRDHNCGFCLRGTVFTRDGRYLLVGRMGGGGIAVIDVAAMRYLRTVYGMPPTPRHLVLSADGTRLYVSTSASGSVALFDTDAIVQAALSGRKAVKPLAITYAGLATRTIALSHDERYLFVTVNRESRLVVLDAASLRPLLRIPADSYPVGLAVAPDDSQIWVTAQGRERHGGNSITVYTLEHVTEP